MSEGGAGPGRPTLEWASQVNMVARIKSDNRLIAYELQHCTERFSAVYPLQLDNQSVQGDGLEPRPLRLRCLL